MTPDDVPEPTWSDEPVIPDWHCVHHGEMGDGSFACPDCATYYG